MHASNTPSTGTSSTASAALTPAEDNQRRLELVKLAAQINAGHEAVNQLRETAFERAVKVGELLLEAKKMCSRGGWLPWLKKKCPQISTRTCQVYMKLGASSAKYAESAHLTIEAGLAALSATKPGKPKPAKITDANFTEVSATKISATLAAEDKATPESRIVASATPGDLATARDHYLALVAAMDKPARIAEVRTALERLDLSVRDFACATLEFRL